MTKKRRIAIALDIFTPYEHHQGVFQGVLRYAREHGWAWVIDEHPYYRGHKRIDGRGAYDGVIARADETMQRRLKRAGVPLVNTFKGAHRPGIAGVYVDMVGLGRAAAEHFIASGHRNLYVLGDGRPGPDAESHRAFAEEAYAMGLQCKPAVYPMGDSLDAAYWAGLERFLRDWIMQLQPPAAVLVTTAMISRVLVDLCQEIGLSVPHDLAVISMSNQNTMLEVPTSISAVGFAFEAMGYEAASMLDGLMAGGAVPDEPKLFPPTGIIARTSTDHFAVRDELVAEALRFITSHIKEKLTVERVADVLAVSPSQLHNRFQASLGHGVAKEVRRLRVSAAKRLLADPTLTIEAVAAEAGFASADAMGHVFKREAELPPSSFRRL